MSFTFKKNIDINKVDGNIPIVGHEMSAYIQGKKVASLETKNALLKGSLDVSYLLILAVFYVLT